MNAHIHTHSMHTRFCMAQSLPYRNLQILEELRSSLKATAKEEGLVYRTKCKHALHFSHTVQHRNGISQEERDTVNRRKMPTFVKGYWSSLIGRKPTENNTPPPGDRWCVVPPSHAPSFQQLWDSPLHSNMFYHALGRRKRSVNLL